MKLALKLFLLGVVILSSCAGGYCAIEQLSVATLDGLGNPSYAFSVGGQIGLFISCYNSESVARVYFEFYIYDPNGKEVFRHLGNSSPGNTGNKSSSLRNIPLTFYTIPGYYTFKGVVTTGALPSEKSITFRILPGSIDLTYPPNGIKELADNPITFRWYSSGAGRYRIYLDDNSGFLNPIWSEETNQPSIQYPISSTDPRQKLSAGVEYWWKVDGLDASGNKIMNTRLPFSFTIKAATTASSDVAVDKLDFLFDDEKEEIFISVYVKNRGGRGEYNIPVTAYLNGKQAGPVQNIEVLQVGETKKVLFDCSDQAKKILKEKGEISIIISGMIDFSDDNASNNILASELKLILGKAKILGRVTDNDSPPKGIGDAIILYSGPISGEVKTNPGGNYVIENLILGEYTLKAIKDGYEPPSQITARVEKRKAYTGNDFVLSKLVTGSVLLIEEPSYEPRVVRKGDAITIRVKVKDFKGVKKVEMHYQLPGEEEVRVLEMKLVSGDDREGVYEAVIKQ